MNFPDKHKNRRARLVASLNFPLLMRRSEWVTYWPDRDWEWRRDLIREERRQWMAELHVPSRRKRKAMASRCAVGVVDQHIPDYLVTMRVPGADEEPVKHTEGTDTELPVSLWQRYASPVWTDINPSETLQYQSAREDEDERHICPLQLEVIRRGIQLWTNPGDVVLSPFAGIGSEGHVALGMGRRFVGAELKDSYYRQAAKNLRAASVPARTLFNLNA